MLQIRKSEDRGKGEFGWLKARYSFSFGHYYDPAQMGFRKLRVINQDIIEPGMGFETHRHQDMEIITYIIEGTIEHQDSLGNTTLIHKGELQRMTAGRGIKHSEYNHSKAEKTHLLQIWIEPNQNGLEPSYEQVKIQERLGSQKLVLLVSPDSRENSLKIHQDVFIYAGSPNPGDQIIQKLEKGRHAWIQMIVGEIEVNAVKIGAGDGLAISNTEEVIITPDSGAKFLFFDLN